MQEKPFPVIPIVAIFSSEAAARAAIAETGAEVLRLPSPGVAFLRPAQGLVERLYAAGAGLVIT
ncbi:hypothetical protein [Muricoccus aerilatus]|uniref:hypothetical protein n=1 Tax=Muricoccus aerilatus TaxID=452982 RepID=UPI0005C228DD|nr:hypothetical protein [Roseomonas aerilata]